MRTEQHALTSAENVETPVDAVSATYHGVEVSEHYRWLEDRQSERTKAWTAAQNARTRALAVALESLVESVRQGSRGWADDDLAFATGWGFPLSEAARETRLWQGELDVLVPRAHCAYLAERLPDARFELVPGAGHALTDHRREILAWLGGR